MSRSRPRLALLLQGYPVVTKSVVPCVAAHVKKVCPTRLRPVHVPPLPRRQFVTTDVIAPTKPRIWWCLLLGRTVRLQHLPITLAPLAPCGPPSASPGRTF